MAYWIHETGNSNNSLWKFFMCDHLNDLKNLPTASKEGIPQVNDTVCKNKCFPGSQCFCIEDSSFWILGKDTDKWIKRKEAVFSGSSSGGVGGNLDLDSINPISSSSIQSLFS